MTRAQRHRAISYVKSVLRIVGYAVIPISIPGVIILLTAAEILGIAEEAYGG